MDIVNQRYLGKLGLMTSVKEEEYSPNYDEKSKSSDKRKQLNSNHIVEKTPSFESISMNLSGKLKEAEDHKKSDEYIAIKKFNKDLESLLKVRVC